MTTAPLIKAHRPTGSNVWALTVLCPFCGKHHTHGGGDGDEPGRLGTRLAHCGQGQYAITDH